MDVKRRDILGSATLAAAWAAGGVVAGAGLSAPATAATKAAGDPERIKRLLHHRRAEAQLHALPSALPGEEGLFDRNATGMSGGKGTAPRLVSMISNDSPVQHNMSPEERAQLQGGFARQALGPTFISYGPMLVEGNFVVEEWESQIYGGNGTLYNNQYLSLQQLDGDEVALFHEYNDTQHAALIYGPPGHWPELSPPTTPRRRNRHGPAFAKVGAAALPDDAIEEVFEITDKFDLDPRMLVDVIPSGAAPPVRVQPGIEGNKALVRGLRRALASRNQARVNSFYAKGFRHFIGGERPFGWDHLPRQQLYAPLVKHIASPLTVRFGPMVADETRVFEQMDSFARLDDGTVYNNWHAFVHEIRDGRIVQTREYHDPRHVWTVLGRWAPWGATPVPPRSSPRQSNLQGIASTIQYPTTFGPDLDRWRPFPPFPA